jgi:enediyne biosynthesis protein E4
VRLGAALVGVTVAIVAVWLLLRSGQVETPLPVRSEPGNRISAELMGQLIALEARERQWNETHWAPEILAQDCGRIFDELWDTLNASDDKLEVVARFPVGELVLGRWEDVRQMQHKIEVRDSVGQGVVLGAQEWQPWVMERQAAGWVLGEVEFRHHQFALDDLGRPGQSLVFLAAQLIHEERGERVLLEGDLRVEWGPAEEGMEAATVRRIDASQLQIRMRSGAPPFQEILRERVSPGAHAHSIDPLILHDLDGNGRLEIILAGRNRVYRWGDQGEWEASPLCRHPPDVIYTGVLADFDGDGVVDFLCAAFHGLVLFRGSYRGTFDEPGRVVFEPNGDLGYPMVLTCGDVNGDGHLDLFLGQYKVPYELGSMPTPYYDANDGHPAFLLLNDGTGGFTDATVASGLGSKRWRRTYSASLVDMDGDGALDLVVVSDFAGVDVYRNDGRGGFMDRTREWVDVPYCFGMSHALSDFNTDGFLDLLMIGMTSATVDRLEHLDLWHPEEKRGMQRAAMMHGNRLYLGQEGGVLRQGALSESIARSGWSWGASAFDFDNDGYPDVYIANGLESRDSVRDYESEYWLHDRFVGASTEQSAVYLYFKSKFNRTRARGKSYGGYDRNRLYWNQSGNSFLEIGHLFGLGFQEDSRNVVTGDLDGDGRLDLVITRFAAWPEVSQYLQVFRNTLAETGRWIGFRFPEGLGEASPVGTQVVLHYAGRMAVRGVVTGDSHRSQHGSTLHFGLGHCDRVDRAEVRWPNGRVLILSAPELNRYHTVPGTTGR